MTTTTRIQDGDASPSHQKCSTPRHGLWGGMVARMGSLALGLALCLAAHAQRTATGTATVINGLVVGVTVTDPGEGYVNPPTVSFSGGGGSGAAATATLSGSGVGSITVTATGSGYVTVPDVIISDPDPAHASLALEMVPLITINGAPGDTNQVQWSSTTGAGAVWVPLTNIVLTGGVYEFYDRSSARGERRFYRAELLGAGQPPAGFVWLPPGRFTMGSPSTEQGRGSDEGPQTVVTLSRGIFMGAHEVTQGEYLAVIGSNPSNFPGDPNRPVEMVSWNEAVNYCIRLTDQERTAGRLPTGWVYRLPTEAEWECAARAGRTNRFSFGDDPSYSLLGEYAWFSNNSGSTTHAVTGKRPNRWGLYDMNGNVWEWCSDWYGPYAGGTATDPQGAAAGSHRVMRGGSWNDTDSYCRSARRILIVPGYRSFSFGFRAVLAPGQ